MQKLFVAASVLALASSASAMRFFCYDEPTHPRCAALCAKFEAQNEPLPTYCGAAAPLEEVTTRFFCYDEPTNPRCQDLCAKFEAQNKPLPTYCGATAPLEDFAESEFFEIEEPKKTKRAFKKGPKKGPFRPKQRKTPVY
jgi:hypothetical protein